MFQEQRDTTISVQVERSEVPVQSYGENIITQQVQAQAIQPEVIELSDDEAEREGPESAIWHYRDPLGYIQGPFPLTLLKRWSDEGYYFDPSFSVWKVGQSPQEAVLLISVLHQYFPVY